MTLVVSSTVVSAPPPASAPPRGRLSGPAARRHAASSFGQPGARPVVLSHGLGTDQTMWTRVLPGLADAHVVTYDLVGSGQSDRTAWRPRRHAAMQGFADDLVELLDELALGPVAFVGHSASAMLGVLAAHARPDLFSRLVLVGGSPRYLDDPSTGYVGGFTRCDVDGLLAAMEADYLAWARMMAPLAMANPDRPELAEELVETFARAESRLAVQLARAVFLSDHRALLGEVRTPALVVQPAQDAMVPEQVGRYLAAALPDARLAQLAATGHFPHISGVEETVDVLRSYLRLG